MELVNAILNNLNSNFNKGHSFGFNYKYINSVSNQDACCICMMKKREPCDESLKDGCTATPTRHTPHQQHLDSSARDFN